MMAHLNLECFLTGIFEFSEFWYLLESGNFESASMDLLLDRNRIDTKRKPKQRMVIGLL